MSKKGGGTVHSVQVLRAGAAILVAFFHCQLAYVRAGRADPHSLETYLFGFGAVGVHVFFVISGFIMVATNPDPDRFKPSVFYWHRLARIFPIYWICCAIALPLHGAAWFHEHSMWRIASALLLNPSDAASIIGAGWTLPFELYFYFCFGAALLLFRRRAMWVLVIFFISSAIVGGVHHWKSDWMHLLTNPLLIEFLMGAGVAKLCQTEGSFTVGVASIVTAAALFIAGFPLGYHRLPSLIVWGIPSALLIFGLVRIERIRGARPIIKLAGRLGDSSYVLYLLHGILLLTAIKASFLTHVLWLGPVTGSIVIVTTAVVISHIMHLAIEAPMLRWLRSLWPGRPSDPKDSGRPPMRV